MAFFTFSGNKLAMIVLAAGALAVGGTGVAAMAESLPASPSVLAETESPSPSPTATETESPDPTPTATETESPDPTPTETESPDPTPTETETESPDPEPTETAAPSPTSTPVGPDATGPAAVGLCNAFAHGGLSTTSVAFAALADAAGGESGIEAYCDTVAAPGDADEEGDEEADAPAADADQDQAQQQVQGQRHEAPANNGAAGQQAGNGAKHSGAGQR